MGAHLLSGSPSTQIAQRQRSSAGCSTSASGLSPSELFRAHSLTRSNPIPLFSPSPASGRLQRSRSLTCAASSTVSKQPLSVYKWPQRRPAVLEWLDHCVQDTVRQLDRAPFVQLVYPDRTDPLETHHVPRTEAGPSDMRQKVAGLLQHSTPDAVVLVHRLPSHAHVRPSDSDRTVSASNVLTGFASHKALDQRGLKYGQSATSGDILAGKVGECCDDASATHHNQILPFSKPHDAPLPVSASKHTSSQHCEQTTDYWGLIVQSKHRSDAEGYYILKTVRNTNPVGCQCTHYSLTQMQK